MATPPSPVETNSLLREVSESVRRRSSSTNTNDFVVDADTQNALSQIKTKFKGAMCDSEGFYQHEGECWNDAIQMVFLFSDGLKEVVQEKLANNEVDINFIPRESIPKIISRYNFHRDKCIRLFPDPKDKYLIPPYLTDQQLIEALIFYLQFFKHRFARHYTMESERREECNPNHNPIKVLHVKGKNAELAAMFGNPTKIVKSLEEFKLKAQHGANNSQEKYLIGSLIDTFFPIVKVESTDFITYKDSMLLNNKFVYAILLSLSNHETSFYTCGGNDFFYEDNYGPFLFPWRDVFFKDGLQFGDITSILFTRLKINSDTLTIYYPVIRTKDNNYFTYYNTILYNFPQNIFDSKPSSGEPTVYLFDNKMTFSFEYEQDKIFILDDKNHGMLSIMKGEGAPILQNSNISNRGFTFKRSRLSKNDYAKVKTASKYGLNINNPLLNWQELTGNNGSIYWYNPLTKKASITNPFLEDKERKEKATKRKEKANKYGLNVNNPLLNWEEKPNSYGINRWYNPVLVNFRYNDPYLGLTGGSLRKTIKRKSYRHKRTNRSRRLSRK
jgi:hypothetical protein